MSSGDQEGGEAASVKIKRKYNKKAAQTSTANTLSAFTQLSPSNSAMNSLFTAEGGNQVITHITYNALIYVLISPSILSSPSL